MSLSVLDLFSGIGGFSLGLERAGMRTVAFCEIDPYCRAVLRKHWPDVPVYGDIRGLTAARLSHPAGLRCQWSINAAGQGGSEWSSPITGAGVDVICGGFPCQDISVAGKGAGIGGERSGLWSEYARIIGEVRPRYVIVENVAALLGRGLERVLGDLAALGFDAEWHCIPASAVGAPHRRDRVWIVAHAAGERGQSGFCQNRPFVNGHQLAYSGADVADAGEPRLSPSECAPILGAGRAIAECGWWRTEPDVGRVANGVPARVDRLRALGNAIVPQIAEIIGRAIMMREMGVGPTEPHVLPSKQGIAAPILPEN